MTLLPKAESPVIVLTSAATVTHREIGDFAHQSSTSNARGASVCVADFT
jgi:hypothetical protein